MSEELLSSQTSWIFLRGLARGADHWGNFILEFQKRFPRAEIELMDIAGNGHEWKRKSFVRIQDHVEDLRKRSRMIQAHRKPFVFSISMGSMIATSWAEKHPNELSGIVLTNTSDRAQSRFFERLRPKCYGTIANILLHPKDAYLREKQILEMTAQGLPDLEKWAEKFSQAPSTQMQNFARQLLSASRYRFPKKRPDLPILILGSRHDQLVNSVCTERIANQWNLTAHFHPKAGHDLPLWAPEWTCDKLEEWLRTDLDLEVRFAENLRGKKPT